MSCHCHAMICWVTLCSALPLFLAHFFTSVRLSSFLSSLLPRQLSHVQVVVKRATTRRTRKPQVSPPPVQATQASSMYHDPSLNLEFVLHLTTEMIKSTSNAQQFDAVTASTSEAIFRSSHHCNTESAR